MKHSFLATMTFVILACGVSSDTGINKSFFVSDGEHKKGNLTAVNGTISVGNEASVLGDCSTVNGQIVIGENSEVREASCVNGSISIDRNSKASRLSCVNGSIEMGSEVKIDGTVSTVNGSIKAKRETAIAGNMETVNGDMYALETLIGGDMSTVNGDIELLENTIVKGDIIIDRKQKQSKFREYKKLVITVDSGSKVEGSIRVKGDDPNVTVVLAGGGEVLGEILNAEVVRK
ncbi:MAG: hypothetical protein K9N35_04865 [Candidatus Marinimicrobia bacterium]|nr:hypothetical protein [Candidatus Neomarinimicrobiota bacterium]